MLNQLKNIKILTAIVYDIVAALGSFLLAICLRFETFNPLASNIPKLPVFLLTVVGCQIISFNIMGLYRGMWRFSSSTDLIRIVKSSFLGTFLAVVLLFVYNRLDGFPRSVLIIDLILLITILGGGRFIYRTWKDNRSFSKKSGVVPQENIKNVIIVGAGSAGNQILKDIFDNPSLGLNVVGFVDDDESKLGRTIQNVKVIDKLSNIRNVIQDFEIQKVFIAIPSARGKVLKDMMDNCKDLRVEFKTLPALNEIISGKVELSLLRNIDLNDLLGRDPVKLSTEDLGHMIKGKTIMVTGAGGSIGSELCTQVSQFAPSRVILFEICEFFLYRLELSLKQRFPNIDFVACIGDVRYSDRVESVISKYRPNLILHAAAYKHVPMMEENPLEAIFTNVLGTKIVSQLASKYGAEKFVMISTDKAVNPTNIMGTSKRIAEMICQYEGRKENCTQFITVRFGNVLGSNGSVIPLFKEQIEKGGPITVTHKDITRFFMSIPEASQLVIQAASMGKGNEIFVLDMGTPVRIEDLAKDLISLSGLVPGEDIEIVYTGLRKGEKLYEELFSDSEKLVDTGHSKVKIAETRDLPLDFENCLVDLISLKNGDSKETVYRSMKNLVEEFTPEKFSH